MEYYFAPMEGVTGAIYRRVHHQYFPGVDKYYMPFVSPTKEHCFTPRERRNLLPQHNGGCPVVPQLLTRNGADFCWAAKALYDMGYEEVNLNLGCPSGTVTAKGKGAGMLARPEELEAFFSEIFGQVKGAISVKTRLGVNRPEEFSRLLEIFAQFPISLLIVHPRVRTDYYRNPVRVEEFRQAAEGYPAPLCYNGGLVTVEDCAQRQEQFPQVERWMLGQGLLANPALIRQVKSGVALEREELRAFHHALYQSYLEIFASQRNTVYHMKELWSYLAHMFVGCEKPLKQIRKAENAATYEAAVDTIFNTLPLRENAQW